VPNIEDTTMVPRKYFLSGSRLRSSSYGREYGAIVDSGCPTDASNQVGNPPDMDYRI
jgi:hypothetical protein